MAPKKVGRPRGPKKPLTEKDSRVLDLLDVIACMSLMPADLRTRREQAVVEEAIKLQNFLYSIGVHRGSCN